MAERIITAIVYAIMGGLGAIVTANEMPQGPVAWCGLALAVVSAGWGKYSSSTTWMAPDREVWSEQVRARQLKIVGGNPENANR